MVESDASFSAEQRDEYIKEASRQPASIGNLYTCDPRFNDNIKDETAYADLSFTVVLNYEKNFWNVRYSRRDQLPFRFQQLLNFGCTTELENFEYVVEYMAQCIRVEELLWQKADEQWYELADVFKKDQHTRQFLITRNTYCAWGVDTKYSGTADPDTVVDNINNPRSIKVFSKSGELTQELDCRAPISGFEYEFLACRKAIAEGRIEPEEMPHSEILRVMSIMDDLRKEWGVRFPMD
jgi:hypothetical protein